MPSPWIPFFERHPKRRELLLAQSGELSERRMASLYRHLDQCEQCRRYSESAAATMNEYALEGAPAGEPDEIAEGFARRLNEVDRELRLPVQIRRPWFRIPRPEGILAAAAVLLCVALFVRFRRPPVAQASEVVERAVQAETRRAQHVVRRIEIRTRLHRAVRDYSGSGARSATGDAQFVAAALQNVSLQWDDPLNARDFQAWRSGLAGEVDEVSSDAATISVKTTARAADAQERTLVVRKADWCPIRQTIRIPGDTIDIQELAVLPETAPDTVAALVRTPEVVSTTPVPEPTVATLTPSSRERRIDAWAILHRLQADVNEQIAPDSKDHGDIEISGIVETSSRKLQLADALAPVDGIRFAVRAVDEVSVSVPPSSGVIVVSSGASRPPLLEEWLRTSFTDRNRRSDFTSRAFTLSAGLSQRASAMALLAEQFPQRESEQLSPHGSEKLTQIVSDFEQSIRGQRAALSTHLAPISGDRDYAAGTGAPWRCEARTWSDGSRRIGRISTPSIQSRRCNCG